MIETVIVSITGKVQGVFFRIETQRAALDKGLTGYVRNMPDGSVQALFQGDLRCIEKMIAWCRQGPPHSRVDGVTSQSIQLVDNLTGFDIRYS